MNFFLIFYFLFSNLALFAQLNPRWNASWITSDEVNPTEYAILHFKKKIFLSEKQLNFLICISADNKYLLYVNGHIVNRGPALGDQDLWSYDTLNIASFLVKGENVIAAMVFNLAEYRGWNQISTQTAFILKGVGQKESIVNTDTSWRVMHNKSYYPKNAWNRGNPYRTVIGCADSIVAAQYPWNWQTDDNIGWKMVKIIKNGYPKGYGTGTNWALVPRNIPLLLYSDENSFKVRRSTLIIDSTAFLRPCNIVIPANTTTNILLDIGVLTNAYPVLQFSKGAMASIYLTYAEALFDSAWQKGNRNEIKGKKIIGLQDVIVADGGDNRYFSSLDYRTYRYVELEIHTRQDPLYINNFYHTTVRYPFQNKAKINSDEALYQNIWNVGWRTAQLCALDTYIDCPYYERIQYIGDTRIQALISLYLTGDDRLMRRAIQLINNSRFGDGLTLSRYPSSQRQVIPPFSLFWVDMLYDHYMHAADTLYSKKYLSGITTVLDWYDQNIDASTGILGSMPYWNFVDWTKQWPWDDDLQIGGVPQGVLTGGSSIISLQYAYTLKHASVLYKAYGLTNRAIECEQKAKKICDIVFKTCWSNEKMMLTDVLGKEVFSQHANIFGILTGAIPEKYFDTVVYNLLNDKSLIQTSYYFKFYLAEALAKAGRGNLYIEMLNSWDEALQLGLSTFPETPEPTRSDCHAWSASPNYHLLSILCGIKPTKAGFSEIEIAPNLGVLQKVSAEMPHPKGLLKVELKQTTTQGLNAVIYLPEATVGRLRWNNLIYALKSGKNEIYAK